MQTRKYIKCFHSKAVLSVFLIWIFFFYQAFLHGHWRFAGQQRKGGDHLLFHSTTSIRSQTLRHLFATFNVRWPSRISPCNSCVYQTATRWGLPPCQNSIWLIDNEIFVCLFIWWIGSRFLLQWFWHGKPVDLNSPCITRKPTKQVC